MTAELESVSKFPEVAPRLNGAVPLLLIVPLMVTPVAEVETIFAGPSPFTFTVIAEVTVWFAPVRRI